MYARWCVSTDNGDRKLVFPPIAECCYMQRHRRALATLHGANVADCNTVATLRFETGTPARRPALPSALTLR
jgi:hypothetical protein